MVHRSIAAIGTTGKRMVNSVLPAKVIQAKLHKRIYQQFADKIGMVYFGFVDQREDEHRLVRGLTVSSTHRDNYYCIGSYNSYDVVLLERQDKIHFPGKPSHDHTWIIMEFDLHTTVDVPHIFFGLHTHSETFYAQLFTKFSTLVKTPLGTFGAYDPSFTSRYVIYTSSAESLNVERLFDPETANYIAAHFGSLTIEINEGCLYIYAEHQRLTPHLLEAMLQNGKWLAAHIDERMAQTTIQ